MNKRGFTLIEITAVVLILGVIFLISYPTLENILKKSEQEQINLDDENIIMAAKTYINLHNDEYEFTEGNIFNINSSVLLEEGLIDNANFNYASCTYTNSNLDCDISEYPLYKNGTAIYFDPEKANVCTKEEADINVNENGTPTGMKTGCMKWYIFNDEKENETVNMMLDHNTTPLVPWNSNNVNTEMLEVKFALESDILTWNDSVKETARLIKAEEIAQITGNKTFTTTPDLFYFDTNTSTSDATINAAGLSKYAWLFDNLNACTSYGCNVKDNYGYNLYNSTSTQYIFGYWTLSPCVNSSKNVKTVDRNGRLRDYSAYIDNQVGIRPIITVDKTIIY